MEQDELIYRSIQERLIVQCGYKTTKVINGNGGMILLVTGGIGYYQEEGKEAIEVPGEENSNEWCEAVSDEEYGKLK